jgi:hypothetical protein
MKQYKRQDTKMTRPVKCRFPQKYRCPTPLVSTGTNGRCDAVTRKVSEEELDFPLPSKGLLLVRRDDELLPQSPLSVVTTHHMDVMMMTSPTPDRSGGFSPTISQVETTIRSVSELSLDHGGLHQRPTTLLSSSSGFLKRRAKSMCLTELVSPPSGLDSFVGNSTTSQQQQQQECEPSPKSASVAAVVGTWGLFVDLDEHHQQVPLLVDRDRRRPLRFRRRAPLKGFILPGIDEATSQLSSLSF